MKIFYHLEYPKLNFKEISIQLRNANSRASGGGEGSSEQHTTVLHNLFKEWSVQSVRRCRVL